MTVLTAIVELSRASWRVLRRYPVLVWFPILSLVAMFAALALVLPHLPALDESWVAVVVVVLVAHLIHTFFAVGLTGEALKALRGEPPSVRAGVATAIARLPAIVSMTAITGTFGAMLALLGRSRNLAIRLARSVVGTAWSLATYLAIPVMVQEGRGGMPSLRRSGVLFRRTWGETALSEVGVRVLTARLALVLVLVLVVLVKLLGNSLFTVLVVVAVLGLFIGVTGALEAIYRAALYVFASEGVVPEPFGGPELDAIWRTKPADSPSDPSPPG
jgi:hypothetical protein